VPSRNGRELLEWSLPPLLAELDAVPGAEVIVVDDGSGDGSQFWLAEAFPIVRVIVLRERRGFAAACNIGAWATRARVVAFLNSDAEVAPGWSRALLAVLERHPEAVIAGGLAVFRRSPRTINSAGIRLNTVAAATDMGLGLPIGEVRPRAGEVAGVSGVAMAVRADWFRATGGFDERLVMYFEDVELCARAWLEGHAVRFTPEAVVLHEAGATAGGRHLPLRNYYGSRNRLLVAARCLGGWAALRAIPMLVAQDVGAVVWLAATGRPRLALRSAQQRLGGVIAGLAGFAGMRRSPWSRVRRQRTFAELEAMGVVEPWRDSIREFARLRRRELATRGTPGP
jgi:GT2 family glycosyltransferase